MDYTELRTVKQLANEAIFVTEQKLRWWIFHADKNGFQSALIKVGGRGLSSVSSLKPQVDQRKQGGQI